MIWNEDLRNSSMGKCIMHKSVRLVLVKDSWRHFWLNPYRNSALGQKEVTGQTVKWCIGYHSIDWNENFNISILTVMLHAVGLSFVILSVEEMIWSPFMNVEFTNSMRSNWISVGNVLSQFKMDKHSGSAHAIKIIFILSDFIAQIQRVSSEIWSICLRFYSQN